MVELVDDTYLPTHHCVDEQELLFVQTIGVIEQIIMEDNFTNLHTRFMEDHWTEFDDSDENKLIYMEIFKKYIDTIEKYIEKELEKILPDFKKSVFEEQLCFRRKQNELEGEIFDILLTFTDFMSFKEKFLDYKAVKEGKIPDLSKHLSITKCNLEKLNFY